MTETPSKLRTVEQTSGEMRVTLRQGGWARWLPAIVRILWLGGWSLGEVLIGNVLLSFTPFAWRIPAPELLASMSAGSERAPSFGIVIFIAAWWLLWTMGGIGSFVTVLRLLFGSDRITMTTDGFRRWRGVGPFGMERELRSGDVSAISIGRSARVLIAQVGAKEIVLASLGTESDRRWLAAELQSRYALKTPVQRLHGEVPPRWESSTAVDESTILRTSARERRPLVGCLGGVAAIWWIFIAMRWFVRSISAQPLHVRPGDVIAITLGIVFAWMIFAVWRARETIKVKRNEIIHLRSFGPWKWQHHFTDSALRIAYEQARGGDDRFILEAGKNESWKRLASEINATTEVLGLAEFLARQTGWDLEVAPQARQTR